jgi:hypothetical protein
MNDIEKLPNMVRAAGAGLRSRERGQKSAPRE